MISLLRTLRNILLLLVLLCVAGVATLSWLWQTRPQLADLPLKLADRDFVADGKVTVTWLGISTLLFDDGETQIITDATFSRPTLQDIVLFQPLESDFAAINRALDEFHIERLAAIIPLHSHFDHAMDAGHVANRTGAMVLGSESTANIARGSKVPVDQYQALKSGEPRFFGEFTVTLIESRHVGQMPNDAPIFSGTITDPLVQPAPVHAWRSGTAYAALIEHPAGTSLVLGSAGFIEGQLADVRADVVLFSIAGVSGHGREYAEQYWQEAIAPTGAAHALAVHFDDFTFPLGKLALFPTVVDDIVLTASWVNEFAAAAEPSVEVLRPPLGQPLMLY
jgi:L-ascorbate metabolism protein UlaG (beta-lactamase superfamily)